MSRVLEGRPEVRHARDETRLLIVRTCAELKDGNTQLPTCIDIKSRERKRMWCHVATRPERLL